MKVIYYADDFGVNVKQSKLFLDCYKKGALNKISILINSPKIDKCYNLIKRDVDNNKVDVSLHLNLLEGKPVSKNNEVRLLTDESGYFNFSYFKALACSFSFKKEKYKTAIKMEMEEQIKKYIELTNKDVVDIAFHQHYHLFPIVHECLDEIIDAKKYNISDIRIPIDPIKPNLTFKLIGKIKIKNIIKWLVLKMLYLIKPYHTNKVFLGLFYSCEMNRKTLDIVYQRYYKYAEKKGMDLEIMFHPGYLDNINECLNPGDLKLYKFFSSPKRIEEYNALINRSTR